MPKPLKPGDSFPKDVIFNHVPPTPETADVLACGISTQYNASKGTFCPPSPFY